MNYIVWMDGQRLGEKPDTPHFGHIKTRPVNHPPNTPDEIELLRRIARQDRQAFAQLYDRYAGVLFRHGVPGGE